MFLVMWIPTPRKWWVIDGRPLDPSQLLTQEKIDHFFRRRPRSEGSRPVYHPNLFPSPSRPPITSKVWVNYLNLRRHVN